MECSAIQKGNYVVIQSRPCCVDDVTKEKGKIVVRASDIFTKKQYVESNAPNAKMDVPIVRREEFQLADIDESRWVLFSMVGGSLKDDVPGPENELGKEIRRRHEKSETASF
ncbi:Eukaryotic translation initiation factor 5A [Entomortierella chlamydospora]|uniref:Eukaryotic translation initiation factor 5A n=1 Tax=Entomortierella chlamydospora TaxID=101097 RepID=A0A9P6MNV6_9FUNG|nr:Eukaryotic translation initiation factor 5A [Entomortierella chlamydospora]KAG0008441.1 Eukaryotic translation initiation factor 5A [Entomortierella chlamydospora]